MPALFRWPSYLTILCFASISTDKKRLPTASTLFTFLAIIILPDLFGASSARLVEMFRRLSNTLPQDPVFPADLEKLGYQTKSPPPPDPANPSLKATSLTRMTKFA